MILPVPGLISLSFPCISKASVTSLFNCRTFCRKSLLLSCCLFGQAIFCRCWPVAYGAKYDVHVQPYFTACGENMLFGRHLFPLVRDPVGCVAYLFVFVLHLVPHGNGHFIRGTRHVGYGNGHVTSVRIPVGPGNHLFSFVVDLVLFEVDLVLFEADLVGFGRCHVVHGARHVADGGRHVIHGAYPVDCV